MSSPLPRSPCPTNSFVYNATLCACNPGYLYNATIRTCSLFNDSSEVVLDSGVDYSLTFPETIFSFDSIKRFTQSQAVFLEATLVMLLSWLIFCFFARFGRLGDGRTVWFKIRWWISRLDVCFATRHWLGDQKVVMKRKTELGGAFSIASWILFIGLFAALLYQIISKRNVEVHNMRATNAPDLTSFVNDFEFNITTISSMSCSNLRGLSTLGTGTPGFIDYRISSLSTFANYSCHNSTKGPTIVLKCNSCPLIRDNAYISWQFIDLPNDPATAVGFQFNLTANNHSNRKHLSFVSGLLKNGSNHDTKPITYRGADGNILKFNLFPRIYHNFHDLKLIQPLFHEFLPGSSFDDISQLQASILSSRDGIINTTLHLTFLSSYIVEIDNQSIMGPVSFLANLGGLYCISIGIFFYLLVQCEYRVKKFRDEDRVMRGIRNRRKAQDRWDKLRKYVMYTWSCSVLDDEYTDEKKDGCCGGLVSDTFQRNVSSRGRKQQDRMNTISFNRKSKIPSEKKRTAENLCVQGVKPGFAKSALETEEMSIPEDEPVLKSEVLEDEKHEHGAVSFKRDVCQTPASPAATDFSLPPLPSLEFNAGSEVTLLDIQKNLESLHEYNAMLREKLVTAQSMLLALEKKASSAQETHR